MAREYVYEKTITLSTNTTNTVFQLAASTSIPITIMRCIVTQSASTTSTQNSVKLVRKTAAATMTSAASASAPSDLRRLDPNDAASSVQLSTTTTGYGPTATDGTDGEIIHEEGFNILNGWYFEPQPECRPTVPAGGIIGIKLGTASTLTIQVTIVFYEGI